MQLFGARAVYIALSPVTSQKFMLNKTTQAQQLDSAQLIHLSLRMR